MSENLYPTTDSSQEDIGVKVERVFKGYSDSRFKFERQWYLNDNFYDGQHFVWWRRSSGTLDRVSPPKGTVLRSIPKASRQLDSIQNLIVANKPRWVVYPQSAPTGQLDADAENKARRSGQWLEFKFDQMNMDEIVGDMVHYALKYPASFVEVYFDPEINDIGACVYDAFDIYFAPESNFYDSPMVIKSVTKSLDEVRANPFYQNTKDLKADYRYSSSEMKELRTSEKFGYHRLHDQQNSVTLKEAWITEWSKLPSGQMKKEIRLVTVCQGKVLRNDITNLSRPPFIMYTPSSGPIYKPAWIERLMSPNKSLDLIVSNIEMFFHITARGRYLQHANATMDRIMNENGQIIKWTVDKPEDLPLPQMPAYVFNHIANLEKWIEEQSTSSVAMGRIPRGVRAYKAIESLKQSDYSNMGIAVTHLEGALEKIAETMLDFADKFYAVPQTVFRLHEEKPDYFNVIGNSYAGQNPEAIPLSANAYVNVAIENGLAYTEESKRQVMLELFSMGLVPPEAVLKTFRFGNVGELLEKAQAQKQASMIDTVDFKMLDPQIQKLAVENAKAKNINIPQTIQPEKVATRMR